MSSSAPALRPPRPAPISWRHRLVARYHRSAEHPGRLRLLGWLKRLLGVRTVRVEVAAGVVMDLDDTDFVQREILRHGGYELDTLRLFERLMGDASGFLDVGAHHGQYALRAARALADRGGRVFAVEPSPANAAALLRNAALSGLTNLDLCTVALSDAPGLLRLVQPQAANTGGSRLTAERPAAHDGPTLHVAVRPFSDLASLVPATAFDLVKIDVEGHEGRVLSSIFACGLRPAQILLEYLPAHFNYGLNQDMPAWLTSHGYEVMTVTGVLYQAGQPLPDDNLWARRLGRTTASP